MKSICYTSLQDIKNKALKLGKVGYETNFMYSFRVFVKGNCTEFHYFNKN